MSCKLSFMRQIEMIFALTLVGLSATPIQAQYDNTAFFGVGTHFLYTSDFRPEKEDFWQVERTLPVVRRLDAQFIKDAIIAWRGDTRKALVTAGDPKMATAVMENRANVESRLSVYDRENIPVFLTVIGSSSAVKNYETINEEFSDWAAHLVQAHPSIEAIQLHNEPNRKNGWGSTPEEYVEVYREYARKIKAVRPDVRIAGGAVSALAYTPAVRWLNRALDAGLGDFVDTIAIHPYNLGQPPEFDPHLRKRQRFELIAEISKNINERAHKKLGIDFTEFGYSTAPNKSGESIDDVAKADYVARSLLIFLSVRASGVPLHSISYYDLKDERAVANDSEDSYGLVSYDLTKDKPSFNVYRDVIKQFGDVDRYELVAEPVWSKSPKLYSISLRDRTTKDTFVAMWRVGRSTSEAQLVEIPASTTIGTPKSCQMPGEIGDRSELLRNSGEGAFSVKIGSRPVWCRFVAP